MRNGVHFFLLTDIAYLIYYEFQGIGWFLIVAVETRFQSPCQPGIGPFYFSKLLSTIYIIRQIIKGNHKYLKPTRWKSTHLKILFIKDLSSSGSYLRRFCHNMQCTFKNSINHWEKHYLFVDNLSKCCLSWISYKIFSLKVLTRLKFLLINTWRTKTFVF